MLSIPCFLLQNPKPRSSKALMVNSPFSIECDKKRDPKYKTELCKKWEETGKCPYGRKCRFAHGKAELCTKDISSNYKKKPCKSFLNLGFCLYGSRCSFKHDERTLDDISLPFFFVQLFILQTPRQYRLKAFESMTEKAGAGAAIHSSSTSTISNDEESLGSQSSSSLCKYNDNKGSVGVKDYLCDLNR